MKSILIADDSPLERLLLEALIRKNFPSTVVIQAVDGEQVLNEVQNADFDLILTDLQMPLVGGMEVVEQVTKMRPGLPVIVITGAGSESTAVQALQAGAANYLPKNEVSQRLITTIRNVLAMSQTRHNRRRIVSSQTMQTCHFELDNDISLVTPLVSFLQDQSQTMQACDDTQITRLGIALHESLTNAIYHGNLELDSELRQESEDVFYDLADHRRRQVPYSKRHVYVEATANREYVRYIIRDEGPGFDTARVKDPTDDENLFRMSGRGLLLIRSFMDEVSHNAKGNEITLVKYMRKDAVQPQLRTHASASTQLV